MSRHPLKYLAAATAAVSLALTTGCISGGSDDNDDDVADATEPADLVFWNTGAETDNEILGAAIDLYEQQNPGSTVELQILSWDDAHAKILTAASGGGSETPDLMSGGLSWGIEFGELGGMVDLREQGLDSLQSNIEPGIWSSIQSTDGSLYGVPLDMTTIVFYYRSDILAAENIEVPTTWDEMDTAVAQLQDAGYDSPFTATWDPLGWIDYFNYLTQNGGSLYSQDCSEPTINNAAGVAAAEYWAHRFADWRTPQEAPDLATGFADESIVMATGGHWNITGINTTEPDLEGKWEIAELPAGPASPGSFIGGRIVGVMSESDYPAQAADFIEFLYSDEAIQAMQQAASAQNSMFLSPRADMLAQLDASDNIKTGLQDTFATAVGPPNCNGWETSQQEVQIELQKIVVEDADPQEALDRAADIMSGNL